MISWAQTNVIGGNGAHLLTSPQHKSASNLPNPRAEPPNIHNVSLGLSCPLPLPALPYNVPPPHVFPRRSGALYLLG